MSLAITPEHQELASVVASFFEARAGTRATRLVLEDLSPDLPSFWKEAADLGWMGLHLPEDCGGSGYGLGEVAIVLEQWGHAVAPGPLLSTTIASGVIAALGSDEQRSSLLPALADGSQVGGVALASSLRQSAGAIEGQADAVLGGELADLILLPMEDDLVLLRRTDGIRLLPRQSADPGLHVARAIVDGVAPDSVEFLIGGARVLRAIARTLAAAVAAGGARRCVEMAAEYAKVREQFGRVIGTFQAVKHHCADMLCNAELATAAAWDAARAEPVRDDGQLGAAIAAAVALPAFVDNAKRNIQVHGGIGFTWEHDAHLYLRRAAALQALFGPADRAREDVASGIESGIERRLTVDLPAEAEEHRRRVAVFREAYDRLPPNEQRRALAESGYLMPHWPKPYGLDAGPVEQLVVDELLGDLDRTYLGIGSWVLLSIIAYGTDDQRERWVAPSVLGELVWCQLFSEPNAGSDAANVQTKAVRTHGGWIVNGQKIWTTLGDVATHGLATVRTDSDVPKHAGISVMVIDMKAPGVEVRPLRQLTGESLFSEVFFTDVFVPDDDVVGDINGGWAVARGALGNEQLSIGRGVTRGGSARRLLDLAAKYTPGDVGVRRAIGALLANEHTLQLLNLRRVGRAVSGSQPGPEGNVTKLVSCLTGQAVGELAWTLIGSDGAALDGPESHELITFLDSRRSTIGGGTAEIARNQIAERLLGLPRDPLVR